MAVKAKVLVFLPAVAAWALLFGSAPSASAQGQPHSGTPIMVMRGGGVTDVLHTSAARVVQGIVYNANDKVLSNAQVYLKDETTSDVRTMLTDEKGNYLFAELPLSHDYKVWADVDGKKSSVKPVSSFLETRDITVNLRIKDEAPQETSPKATTPASK